MICAHHRREARRKEVGCQWEGPEKHRKEVGCQSDVAERRDAGVQVDLLTQQLSWRHSGAPWQCAAVRAGEPGGGALLQSCSTHRSCTGQHVSLPLQHGANSPAIYLLCPTLLPTVFSGHTETSLHPLSSPSPSVPLLTPAGGSAAPPGLIAPLSPRLAEEEEEDDDLPKDDNEKHFCSNQAALKEKEEEKRSRPNGSKREKSSTADKLTNNSAVKVEASESRKQEMKLLKEDEEFQVSKQREKQQQSAVQIQEEHQRERMPMENKDEEKTGGKEDLMKDELLMKEGGGIKFMMMKNEVVEPQRPRRRMVGPTIRYLLESEQQSHGPTAVSHSRVKRKVGRLRKGHREVEEVMEEQTNSGVESSADTGVERWRQLCQVCGLNLTSQTSLDLHMSVHRQKQMFDCHLCNRKFSRTSKLCLHHCCHLHGSADGGLHGSRNGVSPISSQADGDKQEEQDTDAQGDEVEDKEDPGCLVEYWTLKRRKEGAQEKNGARGKKRCREEVKQVCVEEEEPPQRPRRTTVGPPIRYLLESEETSHGPATVSQTNQEVANTPKPRRGRPKMVSSLSEAGGGTSEVIDRPQDDTKEISHMVQNARREDEKEEEPQRPRITVSLPIRYLLDSKETSHGLQTANHNAENKPTQRTGSPQKVSVHRPKRMFGCHLCNRKFSRATKLLLHHRCHHHSNRDGLHNNGDETGPRSAQAADDQQEEQDTDAQGDEEPCEPVLAGPTEAPNCLRDIKRVRKNPCWLIDYWTLKIRRKGAQEKDGGRRRTKRCREEDEEEERREVKQICVEKKQEPQRLRRMMVGPPIRYLLESEEMSYSKQVANKQAERRQTLEKVDNFSEAEGGASKEEHKKTGPIVATGGRETEEEPPQRPKRTVGPPIRYLLEAEETSHGPRTVKQTNQEAANKPTGRRGQPKMAVSFTEAGASEVIDRPEAEAKEMGHMVQKARIKEVQEEEYRRPRRMVGPPVRYLLGSEETLHGAPTANHNAENKPTERTGSPQKVSVHRPKRMFGCHLCNRKFSRATKLLLHHRCHHHSNRDGLHNNGDEADQRSAQAADDQQEEQDTDAQGDEEEEEEQPQRPRRRTVGPPIRYLLESEEMSGTANQNIAAKLVQRRARPKKVVGGSNAGGGVSGMIDRSIALVATERQTGVHTETYLVYRDLQDNQVTIIAPCCVRMQRLL